MNSHPSTNRSDRIDLRPKGMNLSTGIKMATSPKGVSGSFRPPARRLGEILRELGYLQDQDIDTIVALQRQNGKRFGETAKSLGLLKEDQLQRALALQFDFPVLARGKTHISPQLIAAYQPFSDQVEALRGLRSQLMLRWCSDERKSLAVTGAGDRVGASTLVGNLAIVFAQVGERTLLIDANFRRPRQQELFGVKTRGGLCSWLSGRGAFNDAIAPVESFENLSILSAGAVPPNPNELLSQRNFSHLLEIARSTFDVVIIDTPAITEYADAQMIAARADGCILVARRNHTRVSQIEHAKSRLAPSGAMLLGTVLND
jgi:protein-tyrosine kinase